jgi:acetylornithine deacetylase/succinyl-diaminopimelate desuccinylase-like protein
MSLPVDPAANLAALIRCPSVTPAEGGALSALAAMLVPLGFAVERPVFSEPGTPDIENLYARLSPGASAHPVAGAGPRQVRQERARTAYRSASVEGKMRSRAFLTVT